MNFNSYISLYFSFILYYYEIEFVWELFVIHMFIKYKNVLYYQFLDYIY